MRQLGTDHWPHPRRHSAPRMFREEGRTMNISVTPLTGTGEELRDRMDHGPLKIVMNVLNREALYE